MRALKPGEREALSLKGLGYSYRAIMRLTGATPRSTEVSPKDAPELRRQMRDNNGPRH
jgi:hypothetical protein